MIKKEIKSKLIGFAISGVATLSMWGGGTGTIEMRREFIPAKKFSKDAILGCVNDNGFGVESIDSAEICVYCVYQSEQDSQTEVYDRTLFAGKIHSDRFGKIGI